MISCRLTSRNQRPSKPKSPSQPQARGTTLPPYRLACSFFGGNNKSRDAHEACPRDKPAPCFAGRTPNLSQTDRCRGRCRRVGIFGDRAEQLPGYAAGWKYDDLPDDVVRLAKRTILDTIGCAFGGYTAGPSKIAIKLASDVSSRPGATVLLSGISTSPDLAVFANGVMIRYLDFNDAYVSQMNGAGHPSDTIAALLTAGELGQRSGRDLITATVLAYEVYCKIGDVFDYLGHGIDHTTVTGMGAVVGAGKLLGLTPEEMVHAIGITVGGNTATRQGRADPLSNWKAYAAADACRKAIFSVELAQNGMTGPGKVFEGRYGLFKVMGKAPV